MPSSYRHSVSVAGAIVNEGRVLIIKRRDNGHWEPPGGVLELDEAIEDGLVREIREETGVEAVPEALTGVYKNMERGIVALVFRCSVEAGTPRPGDEALQVRWMTPDEISDELDEAYAVRMLDALGYQGRATIRAHDGTTVID